MNGRLLATLGVMLALAPGIARAAPASGAGPAADAPVVVSGVVPDEAARVAILTRLRALYGTGRVVDRLEVGGVVPPPEWANLVARALTPRLKEVRGGELKVDGTQVALAGQVTNEALRQQIASDIATALTPAYTVNNALAVSEDAQAVVDRTLANRVIEFEVGSATLTPAGARILDEMAAAIGAIGTRKIRIVGHTDSSGDRLANVGLSLARADAVRHYLAAAGIPADRMTALGAGPDRPVAPNDTQEGRARNRRIEFDIVE